VKVELKKITWPPRKETMASTLVVLIIVLIVAITIVEIPRIVRLVRAIVLTIREQPYVEAAVSIGTKFPRMLVKHILVVGMIA
jgi:preprotein translocase SecE subunit